MQDIIVYQIDCKIYLMKSLKLTHVLSEIATYVDTALASDKDMLEFHRSYGYKNYVLSGFKELEGDKQYKEGKIYTFSVRCVQKELCDFFKSKLANTQTPTLKGLTVTMKVIPKRLIEKLYSVTPVLIKVPETGYWKGNLSFEQYEKRLVDNTIKKYRQLMGEVLVEDFQLYYRIQFLNRTPISSSFKEINLLGDKIELYISENEMAQKMAYMLLGTGALENNSRGYGYLNYSTM